MIECKLNIESLWKEREECELSVYKSSSWRYFLAGLVAVALVLPEGRAEGRWEGQESRSM